MNVKKWLNGKQTLFFTLVIDQENIAPNTAGDIDLKW